MNPRLATSVEWTSLPSEFLDKVVEVFSQTYKKQLAAQKAEFRAEGRIYTGEIVLRIGIHRKGELAQFNFEISLDFDPNTQKAQERVGTAVDAAGAWFDAYFADEGQEFPTEWYEFEFGEDTIFVQQTNNNSELEAEADRLLGLSQSLYNEDNSLEKKNSYREDLH